MQYQVTFNILIDIHSKAGQCEQAVEVLDEIRTQVRLGDSVWGNCSVTHVVVNAALLAPCWLVKSRGLGCALGPSEWFCFIRGGPPPSARAGAGAGGPHL